MWNELFIGDDDEGWTTQCIWEFAFLMSTEGMPSRKDVIDGDIASLARAIAPRYGGYATVVGDVLMVTQPGTRWFLVKWVEDVEE